MKRGKDKACGHWERRRLACHERDSAKTSRGDHNSSGKTIYNFRRERIKTSPRVDTRGEATSDSGDAGKRGGTKGDGESELKASGGERH
ncbi:MAG: hypothetical protein M3430_08210 [Acidobacteriota bacterium]|nr:hypothetical protein [Acidobacteriota bacterium]